MTTVAISSLPKLEMPLPKYHEARIYTDEEGHRHVLLVRAQLISIDIDTHEMTVEEFARSRAVGLKALEHIWQERQKNRKGRI